MPEHFDESKLPAVLRQFLARCPEIAAFVEHLRRETAEAEGDCRRAGEVLLGTIAVSEALHEADLRRRARHLPQ